MCGRDAIHYTWAEIAEFSKPLTLDLPTANLAPSYNHAPTQNGWALIEQAGKIIANELRWGLIPAWANDTQKGFATFNARIETIASKPTFKNAWQKRRCLIPASGYYEWKQEGNSKLPYYISAAKSPVLMFAGIWEHNATLDITSYSIVTRPALNAIAHLHDRSPVILTASLMREWINAPAAMAMDIALTDHAVSLQWHAVNAAVGNVRNNEAGLILPIGDG
jgi:putative SOS response-associated peptidase YedK